MLKVFFYSLCDKKGAGSDRMFEPKSVFIAQLTSDGEFRRFGPIELLFSF